MKNIKKVLLVLLLLISLSLCSCEFDFPNDNNTDDNHDESNGVINAIMEEYNALVKFQTSEKTTWTFDGTVLDMTATKHNEKYNNYEVSLILSVSDVKVGVSLGQVNGKYPLNIDGLQVGTVVTVTGVIDQFYTVRSGGFYSTVCFTKPEISWEGMSSDSNNNNNDNNNNDNNNNNDDSNDSDTVVNKINFAMINDTHGAFTDSSDGNSIGRVDTLLSELESNKGDYIKIANGDILQGSYVSSKTRGLALIESLNLMEFDAFVIGNHEFDWGLDTIAKYKDGDSSNGEADFPFLGANILLKETNKSPDWIDPYTIVNYGDVKVGIIGVLGEGQESDILKSHVDAYVFASPLNIIKQYSKELRTEQDCDVVVLATHDYDDEGMLYQQIANFSDEEEIDAIFTAHTHWFVNEYITRNDGISIPIVQNKHKNVTIQEVVLNLNENKSMLSFNAKAYYGEDYAISSRFNALFDKYNYLILESEEVIGYTAKSFSRPELGTLCSESMLNYQYNISGYENVSLGLINTGGVRSGFDSGDISVATVFNTFPFENEVLLVKMYGSDIKKIIDSSYFYTYGNDVNSFQDSSIYVIAVVDYAYYANSYLFRNTITLYDTNILMRDMFIDLIKERL